ncbi:SDR family NAD(P)-dependent oxidoreductase [Neiella sp. HB171785]|uniref:SDR family NAD(P)-dependent oxidoreductase n=1 Tax=Neiella litorisoli TaxID=2771431 RepID=A0A8J6QTI4_9GAMM|nr:SDR family NAD(P)-dependent oxidoreductase [Neiella litorisoli]
MRVVVTGATGGIGRALVAHYLDRGDEVIAVSTQKHQHIADTINGNCHWLWQCPPEDYVGRLSPILQSRLPDRVFHCSGILHANGKMPEKALKQFSAAQLQDNMQANCIAAVSLLQALEPFLNRYSQCIIAVLSAKVGSIEDNYLGGWHSYRMSKAALNMAIKTVSIEWRRRFPQVVLAAVHPGTTESKLSQPFQHNVPTQQLASATVTAARLATLAERLTNQDSGALLHWDGSKIPF